MLGIAALGWSIRSRRLRPVLGAVAAGLLAWAVLWAGYGFRFSPAPDGAYALPWEAMARSEGAHPKPLLLVRDLHLAPEAYVFGLTSALHDETRLAYLNGIESVVGWRTYFPIAFLLKTPLGFLALALSGSCRRSLEGPPARGCAVPAAPAGPLRGGVHPEPPQHRAPAPAADVSAAVRACGLARRACAGQPCGARGPPRRPGHIAVSFVLATPGYLSYFNVLGGGARNGWKHLLDSNLDWGQDLKRLAAWQRAHGGGLSLAYFGSADPRAYGLDYKKVIWVHDFRPEEPSVRPASGDLLAVSLNLREGLYLERDRELARAVFESGWMDTPTIRRYTEMRLQHIRTPSPIRLRRLGDRGKAPHRGAGARRLAGPAAHVLRAPARHAAAGRPRRRLDLLYRVRM